MYLCRLDVKKLIFDNFFRKYMSYEHRVAFKVFMTILENLYIFKDIIHKRILFNETVIHIFE